MSSEEAVERRLRSARRAGHPRYVWEDLPMSAWAAGMRSVEEAVAAVLARPPGAPGASALRLRTSSEASARALAVAAFTSGTGPLLGHWIERGALEAPPEIAGALAGHLEHGRARAERVRAHLEALAPALARVGLGAVLLKGTHTAWRWFPEPGARPSTDVDLFVPAARKAEAEAILERAGCRLLLRQRRPVRSVWLPPGETTRVRSLEVTHAANPLTLDLHLSLGRELYGVRSVRVPDPVDQDLEAVPGLPAPFPGLKAPFLLAGLALHASEDLYNLQMVRLVEMVLVARARHDPGGFWGEALELAGRWRALGDAFPALALARALDPRTVPDDVVVAARAQAPPALREFVARLSPATALRLDGITFSERMAGAGTPAEKLRRVLHMLAPDSTGGSLRGLAGLYVSRAYQILRGRVRMAPRSGQEDPPR